MHLYRENVEKSLKVVKPFSKDQNFALAHGLYTGITHEIFKTSSSLKPLDQFSPDFTWGLLSKGC